MSVKDILQKFISKAYEAINTQYRHYCFKKAITNGYLVMGKHSYGMPIVHVYKGSEAKVVIGKYCSIGPDVTFITGGIHPTDWVSTFPFRASWRMQGAIEDGMPSTKGDIQVGNDVWIGTDAMIMSGVEIGDGAVICARSVVTKSIPAYSIAGGIPAKVIKIRFTDEYVSKLLSIKWWEWDEEKIKKYVHLLSSSRIVKFVDEIELGMVDSENS